LHQCCSGEMIPAMRKLLTDDLIAGLRAKRKDQWLGDTEVRGLRLRVTPAGVKAWGQVYRSDGRVRSLSLGRWPEVTTGEARALASEARRKLRHGDDPQGLAVSRSAGMTVGDLLAEFVKARTTDSAEKTLAGYGTYRRTMKHMLNRPAATLRRGDIADGLTRIKAPVAANRCFRHLRAAFRWAISTDLLERDATLGLSDPHNEDRIRRNHLLTDRELGLLWDCVEDESGRVRLAVRLLILLGQRVSEVINMHWDQIELDQPSVTVIGTRIGAMWRVPVTKVNNGHTLPLPYEVVHMLLEEFRTEIPQVPNVPTKRFMAMEGREPPAPPVLHRVEKPTGPVIGLAAAARWQWVKRVQRKAIAAGVRPFQFRDLRRTLATGVQQLRFGPSKSDRFGPHVSERIAGHAPQGTTRKHYNLHQYDDEARAALGKWFDHVQRQVRNANEMSIHGETK
jgi:integrase